jgi:flagellar basal-body rod modification protein FlgD
MGVISPVGVDSNGKPLSTASMKSLDKDDFLKLLVTKLTYQDPLKPMEDEAFIAELAQFSSLEQLQNLNTSLENSQQWDLLQMQTINNTMATGLIGKEVKATYSGVYLSDDNRPMINYTTTEQAAHIKVEIKSADGTVIRTLTQDNVPPGQSSVVWDGKDENGKRVTSGYYTIEISGESVEGTQITPSTFVTGRVTGVVYREGSAFLQVNGLEIPLSDISAINEANG